MAGLRRGMERRSLLLQGITRFYFMRFLVGQLLLLSPFKCSERRPRLRMEITRPPRGNRLSRPFIRILVRWREEHCLLLKVTILLPQWVFGWVGAPQRI